MKALLAVLTATVLALSGCAFGSNDGYFQLKASDAPGELDDFSAVLVQVSKIYILPEGQTGADDEPGEENQQAWMDFNVAFNRQTVDLLQVTGGQTWEFFNRTLEPGAYSQLRLEVKSARGTLKNGTRVDIESPPTLVFGKAFTIEKGKTTSFIADINVQSQSEMDFRLRPNLENTQIMGPA